MGYLPNPPPPFTNFSFAQWSHNSASAPNPALLDGFWRRDAGFSTPPSAQRGDATAPQCLDRVWRGIARSVTRAIGQVPGSPSCHFAPFCRKLGIWWGCALNVIPAAGLVIAGDGVVGCSLMSLVRARRWARWISGSGRSGCQLAAMSQREP